jgi:Tfp pilus assembly protein PilX
MATFYDSFGYYATADLGKRFNGGVTGAFTAIQPTGGPRGGPALAVYDNGTARWISPSNQADWRYGFRYTTSTLVAQPIVELRDTGTSQIEIYSTTLGGFEVRRNGTLVASSANALVVGGSWYHLEAQITVDNAGSVVLILNGVTVINVSGVDVQATANAYANEFVLRGASSAISRAYADLWVRNGADASSSLGMVKAEAFFPTGDGALTDFTPDSGSTHYTRVDEATPDGDTTYNESSTAGHRDSFTFQPFTLSAGGAIALVQVASTIRKTDAGARSIKLFTRISATNYDGSAQTIADSYLIYVEHWLLNPNTVATWTESGVNNGEFGYKLEA